MNTLKKLVFSFVSVLLIANPSFVFAATKPAPKAKTVVTKKKAVSTSGFKYTPIDISKAKELSGTVLGIENDTFPIMVDILLDAGTVKKQTQKAAQKAHSYNVRVRVTEETEVSGKNDTFASFELVNPGDRVRLLGAVGEDKIFEVTSIDDLSLGSTRSVKAIVEDVDSENNEVSVKIGKQIWELDLSGASIIKKTGIRKATLVDFSFGDTVYVSFLAKGTEAEGVIKQLLFLKESQNP